MSILEDAKEVAKLVQEIGRADLSRKIVDLQGEIVNLASDLLTLKKENAELREAVQLAKDMRFDAPFYYRPDDEVPHCPNCWETKKLAVHLLPIDDRLKECPSCRQTFRTGPRPRPMRRERYGSYGS
jgi:hypothetical protein